jgi:hypothetical protein
MCQMVAGIYGVHGKSAICIKGRVKGSKNVEEVSKTLKDM